MRCVGSHTYPKLPKKWSLKARLMAWAAKLLEKIPQPTSTKLYHSSLFLCISSHYCFTFVKRKVGTEFSQESSASDSDDESECNCYSNYGKFVRSRSPGLTFFLTNLVRTSLDVALLMTLQKQDKGITRVGKAKGSVRIGSSLKDKVTKSDFDQIYTCGRKL